MTRQAIGISAAGFLCFVLLYTTQPMLAVLSEHFQVPLPQTGLTVTAILAGVALVAPFAGGLSELFGRKRLMVAGASLVGVPTVCAALAPTYGLFLLCRFVQGLALPFIFAVSIAYITEEFPGPQAIRLTGRFQIAGIGGGFLGRVGAGYLTDWFGWRAAFFVGAAVAAVCATLVATLLPAERRFVATSGLRASFASYGTLLTDRRLIATFCLGFTVLFAIVGAFTFANVHLAGPPFFLGPGALGAIFTVYLIGTFTTSLAARLAIRYGRKRSVALWVAVSVCGALLTLWDWLPAIILGLGLIAAGVFPEQTLSLNVVASSAPRAKSTAVGIYTTAYYLGGACGGILPATIWNVAGWPGCVAMVIALQMFVLGVVLATWRDDPTGQPARG
jgi:MFS family permease